MPVSESKLRIVIADDHTVVRSALRMLLEAEPDIEVVAEAGDAGDALRYVRGHRPDVLILDLNMPGVPSLEILPELKEASPETGVVILTMQSETEFARRALDAGAGGYVLKEAADSELMQAIHAVADGETYLQPTLGVRMARESTRSGEDELSEREIEVLRLVAEGYSNREIAGALHLAEGTVKNHVSTLLVKLNARDRTNAVLRALHEGLLG